MTGAEAVLIGTAVVGTAAQIYGQIAGAGAQVDAAERNALLKQAQADELLSRQAINESIMEEEAATARDEAKTLAATTMTGKTGLGEALEINRITARNISLSRREAEYQAQMLRAGADIETQLASDALTASYVTSAGTLLSNAGQTYKDIRQYGKPSGSVKDLPKSSSAAYPNAAPT